MQLILPNASSLLALSLYNHLFARSSVYVVLVFNCECNISLHQVISIATQQQVAACEMKWEQRERQHTIYNTISINDGFS